MAVIAGRCFSISVFLPTLGNILKICDIFSYADFPCHLLVVGLVHLHPGQTFNVTFLCLSALSQPALITFTLINILCWVMNPPQTLYNSICSANDNGLPPLQTQFLQRCIKVLPLLHSDEKTDLKTCRSVIWKSLIWNQQLVKHSPDFGFKSIFVLEESLKWGQIAWGKLVQLRPKLLELLSFLWSESLSSAEHEEGHVPLPFISGVSSKGPSFQELWFFILVFKLYFSEKVPMENKDIFHVLTLTLHATKGNCIPFTKLCS